MAPTTEPVRRRRPSVLVTVMLVIVAIPALLFTACGVSMFVGSLAGGGYVLLAAGFGLFCAVGGGCALYALYRVARGD